MSTANNFNTDIPLDFFSFPTRLHSNLPDICQYLGALGIKRGNLVHDILGSAMHHLPAIIGVLHGEIPGQGINICDADAPGLSGIGFGFLQFDEFGQVVVVERVGFAHVAAGIELVVPDCPCRRAFLKEEHHGFDARPWKVPPGQSSTVWRLQLSSRCGAG